MARLLVALAAAPGAPAGADDDGRAAEDRRRPPEGPPARRARRRLLAGSDAALAAGGPAGSICKRLEDCALPQFGKRQRKTVATLEGRMKKYEPGPAMPAGTDAEPGEQPLQALRRLGQGVWQGRPPDGRTATRRTSRSSCSRASASSTRRAGSARRAASTCARSPRRRTRPRGRLLLMSRSR